MVSRHLAARTLLAVTVALLFGSACTRVEFVQFFGREPADEAELAEATELWTTLTAVAAAVEQARLEVQLHPWLVCLRHRESDRGAYPHTRGYGAYNPGGPYYGAYQYLDSTWAWMSEAAGFPGYAHASNAPWHVQDAVALWAYNNGQQSHWPGC